MAHVRHFNTYDALYFGLALVAVALVLMHSALTMPFRRNIYWWLLWPMLSALLFSVSKISSFEHAFESIVNGYSVLGLAVGVWGLVRFPRRWPAIALMTGGALLASSSLGNGVILWPLFLGAMLVYRFRSIAQYAVVVTGGLLSSYVYVRYLVLDGSPGRQRTLVSIFNPATFISILGWPFVRNTGHIFTPVPTAWVAGGLLVALVIIGGYVAWASRDRCLPQQTAAAWIILVFGVLSVWQISMFRQFITPWYTPVAIDCWIGLVGLAYVLLMRRSGARTEGAGSRLIPAWGYGCTAVLLLLYVPASSSWSDKSILLNTRGPAAAACLRNYHSAPTYCELCVTALGGGTRYVEKVGTCLEAHHLSVFGPHQTWTLQGDSILDTVGYSGTSNAWAPGLVPEFVPFTNYRHLNLLLRGNNRVWWTVAIPQGAKNARLETAVAASSGIAAAGVTIRTRSGAAVEHASRPVSNSWKAIVLPLTEYEGQTIRLEFAGTGEDWVAFRYPRVELDVDNEDPPAPAYAPSNTDLSPAFSVRLQSAVRVERLDSGGWSANGLEPVEPNTWRVTGDGPSLRCAVAAPVALSGFTHLYIKAGVTGGVPAALSLALRAEDGSEYPITLPLLHDGDRHSYLHRLDLAGIKGTMLTAITIRPVQLLPVRPEGTLYISDLELITLGNGDSAGIW
jgi:hypothetical protein